MKKAERRPLSELEKRYKQGYIDGYLKAVETIISNSKKMYEAMQAKKEGGNNG